MINPLKAAMTCGAARRRTTHFPRLPVPVLGSLGCPILDRPSFSLSPLSAWLALRRTSLNDPDGFVLRGKTEAKKP
jgi:hypothetical protein